MTFLLYVLGFILFLFILYVISRVIGSGFAQGFLETLNNFRKEGKDGKKQKRVDEGAVKK